MQPSIELLVPRPREAVATGDSLTLPVTPVLSVPDSNPAYLPAVRRLERALEETGLEPLSRLGVDQAGGGDPGGIRLRLDPGAVDRPQCYLLEVTARAIEVTARDEAGLFYGVCTLIQWLRLHPRPGPRPLQLSGLRVSDGPELAHRGVLLDISRDRVPTMDALLALVDRLAGWKINQLQLYTEHTFAYRGHEVVWRGASPITAEEVRRLDDFCGARMIELVPNQNSLGHFHRWLVHPPYRELAEFPEGLQHPFSDRTEPFSLCPTDPRSLELVADLYDQLLPQFTSRTVNVGLDEAFDIGRGRSAAAAAEKGVERVYLEYLQQVRKLLLERGRRMQFWADMVIDKPELLARLPGDTVPLEWGYEADHPFAERGELLAAAGLDFYLCPGTSSWNSFGGRLHNALHNLAAAVAAAHRTGARGLLITDWGDFGHLQPPAVSYPGLLAGAAMAWNPTTAADPESLDLATPLDLHAFGDPGRRLGGGAVTLGNAYRAPGIEPKNGSVLFFLVLFAHQTFDQPRFRGLKEEGLERARAEVASARDLLAGAAAGGEEAELSSRELSWTAEMMELACDLGSARLTAGGEALLPDLPRGTRRGLGKRLGRLLEAHRGLWLERSRPGGLEDSAARLERVLSRLG